MNNKKEKVIESIKQLNMEIKEKAKAEERYTRKQHDRNFNTQLIRNGGKSL